MFAGMLHLFISAHYFCSVSRPTCKSELDSFKNGLQRFTLWCGFELGSTSIRWSTSVRWMDLTGLWDTVQGKGFRPVEHSESHATLCNLHIQVSNMLLIGNRPEVKWVSWRAPQMLYYFQESVRIAMFESPWWSHHADLDIADIIRPCLELVISKVGRVLMFLSLVCFSTAGKWQKHTGIYLRPGQQHWIWTPSPCENERLPLWRLQWLYLYACS